jgi:alpha-tubulin suppressor-like RCC1 family protein
MFPGHGACDRDRLRGTCVMVRARTVKGIAMVKVASSGTSGRGLHRTGVLLVAVVGLLFGLLVAVSPAGAGTSGTTAGAADGAPDGLAATAGGTAATGGNTTGPAQQSEADAVAYINAQNTGTVKQVSGGKYHSCAVTTDGYVFCWGYNDDGRLGNGSTTKSPVPVQVCAVGVTDTSGECKSADDRPQVLSGVVQVSAGGSHSCAVTTDGYVFCWGYNGDGRLGNGLSGSQNNSPVPVRVVDVSQGFENGKVSQVSAGGSHSCAVTTDGYVFCWGYNGDGRLGNGSTTKSPVPVKVANGRQGFENGKVVQVSAGGSHSCAVAAGGVVFCWGYNAYGQLGNGSTTKSPVPVKAGAQGGETLSGVVQVSAGGSHSCAVAAGGVVFCWGRNDYGQLGNDGNTKSPVPVKAGAQGGETLSGVVQVSAGGSHSCAVTAGNTVYCWGYNAYGQLGNDGNTGSSVPVKVVDRNGFVNGQVRQVSAGGFNHSCAVTDADDGAAFCWGGNTYGQLGNGSTTKSPVPVPVAGQMRVVPSSVPFGTVEVGDSAAESVTLKHSFPFVEGGVVVNISEKEGSREGFVFTPAPAPGSGCTNDRAASTLTLTGGQPCSGAVTFAPEAPGSYGGIVALTPELYPNAGAEFAASGYGEPGADPDGPVVKADAVDFGKVDVYTAKVETVKVKNTGDEPLEITGGKITSDPDDEFAADLADCTDGKVAVGKSCTAKVQFFPRQAGESAALLELKSNAVGSATIALSGEGVAPANVGVGEPTVVEFEKASEAALEAVPGGTVIDVVELADGGFAVTVIDADGNEVVVILDEDFNVVQILSPDDPFVQSLKSIGPVKKLRAPAKKVSAKKAQVKWKKPKGEVTITRYQSRIKKSGSWKKWSGKGPQPDVNGWISRGYKKLKPNTTYKVQVRAWSYEAYGPKRSVKFRTDRKGVPTKPGNG